MMSDGGIGDPRPEPAEVPANPPPVEEPGGPTPTREEPDDGEPTSPSDAPMIAEP